LRLLVVFIRVITHQKYSALRGTAHPYYITTIALTIHPDLERWM